MEYILALSTLLRRLVCKRATPRKAVVHLPDQIRVTQRLAPKLRRKLDSELPEVAQLFTNIDILILVQQHAQQRLGSACILNRLRGEEHAGARIVVERPVLGCAGCVGRVGGVFEEKDEAVERLQGGKFGGIEREELFELDILHTEVLDQGREDASVGLDWGMLMKLATQKERRTGVPTAAHGCDGVSLCLVLCILILQQRNWEVDR